MTSHAPTIENRKAKFLYHFVEEYTAGIVLSGAEVKSIRLGSANLTDAYCYFKKDELYVKNIHIAEYKFDRSNEQDPTRERKLLLKRRELVKLRKKINEKGLTIIPYQVFFSERGIIKVQIALAKGKKVHDKRDSIKDRDNKRNLDRIKKSGHY